MKKITIFIVAITLLAIASCQGNKRCPAYDSVDNNQVQNSQIVELLK